MQDQPKQTNTEVINEVSPIIPDAKQSSKTIPLTRNNKKRNLYIIGGIIGILLVLIGVGVLAEKVAPDNFKPSNIFGLQSNKNADVKVENTEMTIEEGTPAQPKTPSTDTQPDLMFSGSLKPIDTDLQLLLTTTFKDDKFTQPADFPVKYYSAGVWTKGKYKDYTRILALTGGDCGGFGSQSNEQIYVKNACTGTSDFWFATKDMKSFIVEKANDSQYNFGFDGSIQQKEGMSLLDYLNLNKSKVTDLDKFDSVFTPNIKLSNGYELKSYHKFYDFSQAAILRETTNESTLLSPRTDVTKLTSLSSDSPNVSYYHDTNTKSCIDQNASPEPNACSPKTVIYVRDSIGLLETYYLNFDPFVGHDSNDSNKLIVSSEHIVPNEAFKKDGAKLLYSSYGVLTPGACGQSVATSYLSIAKPATDLTEVATINNQKVYALTDKQNQIYKDQYKAKVDNLKQALNGKTMFEELNNDLKPPSYNDYVVKNPVLIMQDPWGNFFGLGEFEYIIGGGCGKPVLYFYPTQDTKVNVKFNSQIKFDVQIPSYNSQKNEGWNFIAHPNGMLTDIQTQLTPCDQFKSSQHGQEYALTSCNTNSYPYIYWAGQSLQTEYPQHDYGFVVSYDDLDKTMSDKLTEIGFNQTEIADFKAYWLPYLQSKHATYYRLTFFQNQDLNSLFPMTITPQPDSSIRMFMDWEPLQNKIILPTQQLQHFDRNGFTVVEWGGLKK